MNIDLILMGLPYISAHPTGSNFTCDPPVENTDRDIVVLIPRYSRPVFNLAAIRDGWDIQQDYGIGTVSYRQGDVNLIVIDHKPLFYKWIGATYVAKLLNLQRKEDRVAMFNTITQDFPLPPGGEY